MIIVRWAECELGQTKRENRKLLRIVSGVHSYTGYCVQYVSGVNLSLTHCAEAIFKLFYFCDSHLVFLRIHQQVAIIVIF